MNAKTLSVNFGLKIENEDQIENFIEITAPGIYRAGLELNGYKTKSKQKNIITWGAKEQNWLLSLDLEIAKNNIEKVISCQPPLLILSPSIKQEFKEIILEICNKHKVPLIKTELHASEISSLLSTGLVEKFAPKEELHASLMEIEGIGVMIQGASGIGKSEAVVELIQAGYNFVSDDTVIIKNIGNKFFGTATKITKGFLEVRGLGLIDVPHIYGARIMRDKTEIQLVVNLVPHNITKDNNDRLGITKHYVEILGGKIRKVIIPVKEGKSVTSLIIAAVNLFLAEKQNHNPLSEIENRIKDGMND